LQNRFGPEQNDAVAPKPLVGFFSALQPKRLSNSLAGKAAGHFSHAFPSKIMPLEDGLIFFLRNDHASYKKAGLATVGAFRAYGTSQGYLMRRNEPL